MTRRAEDRDPSVTEQTMLEQTLEAAERAASRLAIVRPYALADESLTEVWAGTTGKERRAIRARGAKRGANTSAS